MRDVAVVAGIAALGIYVAFAIVLAWSKYERWLRSRRRGDVEIGPTCSREGRPR